MWKFSGCFSGDKFGLLISKLRVISGWGVKPLRPIPKGAYVQEYKGTCIHDEDVVLDILKDPPPLYVLDAGTHWIHATRKTGNISRYFNHSCNPNLVAEVWSCKGRNRIFFRALRDIAADEEVTFNYNSNNHRNVGDWPKQKCKCTEDCPNSI
jgi:uncharacterized protein